MNCCDARSTLPLLLDGQLAAGERAAAVDKAMACGLCRAELAAMAQNDAALRRALAAQMAHVPAGYFEDFAPRLMARLDVETLEGESMRTSSGSGPGDATVVTPPPTGGDLGKDVAGKPLSSADEFSGLHEIKALAASAVRRSTERRAESEPGQSSDALIATPAALSSVVLPQPGREVAPPKVRAVSVADADGVPAAALSVPMAAKSSRVGLYVGALGLLVAAGAVGLYVSGAKKSSEAAPAATVALSEPAPAATPPSAPTPTVAPVAAAAPAAEAKPEEARPSEPAGAPAVAVEKASKKDRKPDDEAKAGGAVAAVTRTEKDKPAAKEPAADAKPAGKEAGKDPAAHNEIDDIFGDKPTTAAKPAAPAGPALPEKLGQDDVKKGMASVKARVQACYDEFKVSGTIKLKVKIEVDGTVSSADVVDDKFKATDTGACVSAAVKTAKFPAVSGTSLVVSYPFILQ
jgi:hypothetical protein